MEREYDKEIDRGRFQVLERKALEGGKDNREYEMLKLIGTQRNEMALMLSTVGGNGGSFFGAGLWEQLSSELKMLEDFFDTIGSVDQFHDASDIAFEQRQKETVTEL